MVIVLDPDYKPTLSSREMADPLLTLNEKAAQIGVELTWTSNATGEAHDKTWRVECKVDNVSKGRGRGKTKQLAKKEAAQAALTILGWVGASPHFQRGRGQVTSPKTLEAFAQERGHHMIWRKESSGPAHMLWWKVCYYIDGEARGIGTAGKLEQAKREAARQTFILMGWVDPSSGGDIGSETFADSDDGSDTVTA